MQKAKRSKYGKYSSKALYMCHVMASDNGIGYSLHTSSNYSVTCLPCLWHA